MGEYKMGRYWLPDSFRMTTKWASSRMTPLRCLAQTRDTVIYPFFLLDRLYTLLGREDVILIVRPDIAMCEKEG
jgi:hypothetical protein